MPYQRKEKPQSFRRTWKEEPERTFEAFAFPGRKSPLSKRSGSQSEREKSGKRIRGENEGSSFHLDAPDNAAKKSLVSIILEQGTPTVRVEIEEMLRSLIIDTSSNISILQPGMSRRDVSVTTTRPCGVAGEVLDIKGLQSVTFTLNGREFTHAFLVCALPAEAAGLLGTDLFEKVGAVIDFECSQLSLTGIGIVQRVLSVPHAGHAALTIFTKSKAGRSSQLSQKEARRAPEQVPAGPHPEVTRQQENSWLVRARENIVLAPRCRQIVVGRLESEKEQSLPSPVCVEPVQISIEGILPARALSRVESNAHEPSRVISQSSHSETGAPSRCANVMLANFSNEPLVVPKATVLCVAEEISASLVNKINPKCKSESDAPVKPHR